MLNVNGVLRGFSDKFLFSFSISFEKFEFKLFKNVLKNPKLSRETFFLKILSKKRLILSILDNPDRKFKK